MNNSDNCSSSLALDPILCLFLDFDFEIQPLNPSEPFFISSIFTVRLFLTFLQFLQLCPHIVPAGGVEEGAEAVGGSEAVGSRRRRVAWPEAATHSREEVSPQRWGGGRILQVFKVRGRDSFIGNQSNTPWSKNKKIYKIIILNFFLDTFTGQL